MSKEYTTAWDVYDSFETSFQDKKAVSDEVERIWLNKAIARYSQELRPLHFDNETMRFDRILDGYVIDTLASFMKQSYQERYVSKVNKMVSIVGKDLSIDGNNGSKTAAANELEYDSTRSSYMVHYQKPTAYV